MTLRKDDYFAGCRILSVCGEGGSGIVYLAENAVGQRVALKVLHTHEAGEKELRGVRNYMRIRQGNSALVFIHHAGIENGSFFYIMDAADNASDSGEYIPDTLAHRMKSGRLPLDEALNLCMTLLDGLSAMHDARIIHRDIKPENIFFIDGRPVLGDPGLVGEFSRTLSVSGTLGFLPPELFHASAKPSPNTDIYALGKVLYCAVTGNRPGDFPTMPPEIDEDTLARCCLLLAKLCNADPRRRCQNCAECRRLLLEATHRTSRLLRFWWRFRTDIAFKKKILRYAGGAVFVVLLAACLAAELWNRHFIQMQTLAANEKIQKDLSLSAVDELRKRQEPLEMQFNAFGAENPARHLIAKAEAAAAAENWREAQEATQAAVAELIRAGQPSYAN